MPRKTVIAPRFRPLGGSARRYLDTESGREISRTVAIRLSTGQTVHQRVAATAPEIRATRPARGRQAGGNFGYYPKRASQLIPLQGTVHRRISAGRTAAEYNAVLRGLKRNSQVEGAAVIAVYNIDGHEKYVWLQPLTPTNEVIDGETASESIGIYDTGDIESEIAFNEGRLEELDPDSSRAIAIQARIDDLQERLDNLESGELQLGQISSLSPEFFVNFAFHVHFRDSAFRAKPEKKPKKSKHRKMAYVRDEKGKILKHPSGKPRLRKRKKPPGRPRKNA